jgi:Flp pilus assembly protein TadG
MLCVRQPAGGALRELRDATDTCGEREPLGAPSPDAGQATVEVALVVPFLIVMLLVVMQVGVLVRDQVIVTSAAREAARAAAVTTDPEAPARAARAAGGLEPGRLTVVVERNATDGDLVRATVRYGAATDVPLVGSLLPDVTLAGRAAMRSET